MKATGLYILLAGVSFLVGCNAIRPKPEVLRGHYYLNSHKNFSNINRVALLELVNRQPDRPEISEMLTRALANGLSKKHLFTVRTIYHSEPVWTDLGLDHISEYSHKDLERIREVLKVDAVIFGTIDRYQSFPHLLIAMRLKMVDVCQADLIWGIEQVWDSTDRQVELRMQQYYKRDARDGYQPLNWKILVTSPRAFNKFVVDEIGDTLPELTDVCPQTKISGGVE